MLVGYAMSLLLLLVDHYSSTALPVLFLSVFARCIFPATLEGLLQLPFVRCAHATGGPTAALATPALATKVGVVDLDPARELGLFGLAPGRSHMIEFGRVFIPA